MRQIHSTITPSVIHHRASLLLQRALPWQDVGRTVTLTDVLDLLLLMASTGASLSAIVRRFFAFSIETARQAVYTNLPEMDPLVDGLVQTLYDAAFFSRHDRRRRWLVAIDLHYVPYYGQRTEWVVGGPKRHGTKWFFGYATAVLLHKGRRYTVGLCPVAPRQKPHAIVAKLLAQIEGQGLKIKGLVLDSGFDSGETVLLLQALNVAYTVPLRRKGNTRNARNRLFEGRHKQVRWAEWNVKDTPRQVRTRTVLWKGGRRTMLFAFGGFSSMGARDVHQEAARQKRVYQRRFGIETSYRQKNQAQAKTTSVDPVYRMLLEGLGYLLRQLWVTLTAPGPHGEKRSVLQALLPLKRLLDWLLEELRQRHPEQLIIAIS